MTDIVQVQFKSKYRDEYAGREYTYRADVPLNVGDVVKVPTRNGDGEARVCAVDVPESQVEPWLIGQLQHITEPATVGSLFDGFM